MDETKVEDVKAEPKSEPPLFMTESAELILQNECNPLWKRAEGTLLQQVEVMEQSLRIALPQLVELKSKLLEYTIPIPLVTKVIGMIDAVMARKKKCKVTAGAIAPTGMGKSSAWNAVLGFPELLPTDNANACTSAIIEVSYNSSNDPAAVFRAAVTFLEVGEWETEITNLYKDMEALKRNETGDDDERDVELECRIDTVMEKVRAVYPFIDDRHDLKRYNTMRLMNNKHVKNLGQQLIFSSPDLKDFAAQIRRYIVNAPTGGKTAQWPLVKVVEIYVKSQVLEDGLVLVDIPGSMDTNPARNALAQLYQRQLSVTCIMTASKRAASDQTAQISLNETLQRNMQLDGRWKTDNIIFIVVRTDESIDVHDHISKNPILADKLSPLLDKEKAHILRKSLVQQQEALIRVESKNAVKANKDCDKKVRILFAWFNEMPEMKAVSQGRKRKAMTELLKELVKKGVSPEAMAKAMELDKFRADRTKTKKLIHDGDRKILMNHEEVKKVETILARIRCKKMECCIVDRSESSTAKIRDYFGRVSREMGTPCDPKSLPVFCISAAKYLDIIKNAPPSPGFPHISGTQIPQLRKALMATTLESRHRNAKTSLVEIETLLSSVHLWTKSLASTIRLTGEQKAALEESFDETVANLLEKFSLLNITASESVRGAIEFGLSAAQLARLDEKAALNAPNVSDRWAGRPVAWKTYRAILERSGEFRSVVRPEPYSWNGDLSGNYFSESLTKRWTKLFDSAFPPISEELNEKVKDTLVEFSQTIVESVDAICPEIHGSAKSLAESIVQQGLILQESYQFLWEQNISTGRMNIHRHIAVQIKKFMTVIYEKAKEERGKGYKKRANGILRDYLKCNGQAMYKESTSTLVADLEDMAVELKDDLDSAPPELIEEVREIFHMMLDNHKPLGRRLVNQKAMADAKNRLLKDVSAAISHLDICLEHNVQIPCEEEDEPAFTYEIDEHVSVDAADSDSDLELSSGSEDEDDDPIVPPTDPGFVESHQPMDLSV